MTGGGINHPRIGRSVCRKIFKVRVRREYFNWGGIIGRSVCRKLFEGRVGRKLIFRERSILILLIVVDVGISSGVVLEGR